VARLLVQLKLRQHTNALRASGWAKASFVISTIFAVLVAIGTFVILALLRDGAAPMICAAAYCIALVWGGVETAARAAAGKLPELAQVALSSNL
jgi:hypothetical protein